MDKIVVCLKPTKTNLLNYYDNETLCISPYDMDALLKALQIKSRYGYEVICLCMGIRSSEEILYKCIAMGVDQAILLNDPKFTASDTHATALVLSAAIRKIKDVRYVFCGKKSIDGETGQVPLEIASKLNLLYVPHVMEIVDEHGGLVELLTTDFLFIFHLAVEPPFIAIFNDLSMEKPNVGLRAIKLARRQKITIWDSQSLGFTEDYCFSLESKTKVMETKKQNAQKQPIVISKKSAYDVALEISSIIGKVKD